MVVFNLHKQEFLRTLKDYSIQKMQKEKSHYLRVQRWLKLLRVYPVILGVAKVHKQIAKKAKRKREIIWAAVLICKAIKDNMRK